MSEDTVAPFAFWSDETAQRSKFCWKNSGADTAARAFSQAVLQSGEDAKEREAQERRNAFRALSQSGASDTGRRPKFAGVKPGTGFPSATGVAEGPAGVV